MDARIQCAKPFTENEIAGIEHIVGRRIPDAYKDFVCTYGGAFIGGLIDGKAELPILSFFDADAVLTTLRTHGDLREDGVLPVADCELGNLYVIDRAGAVHYINYYGGRTTARRVADEFGSFLSRIVVSED